MKNQLSPMMQNYLQTKEQYKDCILLYRLGDFYEMFFEDAEVASRILDLTLTGRNCGLAERAPMCGVPYHAVDVYVAKLIAAGKKVAICEQLTQPTGKANELVKRDVVRVITSGTVMETEILDGNRSNYIASVFYDDKVGIAVCDISTGDFFASEFVGGGAIKDLQEFLVSYKPAEIIANSLAVELSASLECVRANYTPAFSRYDDGHFDKKYAKDKVQRVYNVATLDGFGLAGKNHAVTACSALFDYLKDTQKRDLPHLKNIRYIDKSKYMSIDVKTRRNLELTVSYRENKKTGSLLWLLDKTQTTMGGRMLADWVDRPLQKVGAINARLDGVEELYRAYMLRSYIAKVLHDIGDIERIAGKIAYNNVNPKECVILKDSLLKLPELKRLLAGSQSKIICEIDKAINPLTEVADLLGSALEDNAPIVPKDGSEYIKRGYSEELDELYDLTHNGARLLDAMERRERETSGIKTLKLGFNKVFGYFYEVSKSLVDQVPEHFIRKQTLTTGERFVTPELKELEDKMLSAYDQKTALQKKLFEELRIKLLQFIPTIQSTAQAVAALDCLYSLATVAEANNYCKPKLNSRSTELKIIDGRHPIVESYIKRDNFITNDVLLDTQDNRTMIITGPNMAGKSTFMRQVALITLMAHIGSFVPASSAEIPIVDKIFTRVGASDDLAFNQSTFMVEMVEVANILNNATPNSLIILDEVGRGTSTFDGLSIAWAVMEYVSNKVGAKTLFATHYHELTDLEGRVEGVKNYRVTVKEFNGSVVFLHKIVRGGTNKSFGIEVASLAGVPTEVCDRAREIVLMLENSSIDYNLANVQTQVASKDKSKLANEVVSILADIDINRVSPIEAFDILNTLVNKVNNNE